MDLFKKISPWIIILVLTLLVIWPFFHNGFFPMHDDTQPTRIFEMAKALQDGQFPVRWVKDLGYGYGYPIFNFYAPLPYYFGALFVYFGVSTLIATKLMFIVGILLSAISMYLLGNFIWGKKGGIISALIYLYSPYHAVQIFVRGAVGEYWAYGFLPLIIYGILKTRKNFIQGWIIGVIGLAGLILSHNITAMVILIILGLWFIYELIRKIFKHSSFHYHKAILFIILLSLSLTAFFWLPAIFESKYTAVDTLRAGSNDFHQHFVFLNQLWDSTWGFGGSAPGLADGMSFKIGKIGLITSLIVIISFLLKAPKNKKILILSLTGFFIISIILMLSFSVKIWELSPIFGYIQYPWRLLVFTDFLVALICGGIFITVNFFIKNRFVNLSVFFGIITIVLFINLKYFQPQLYNTKTNSDYISDINIKWTISKISDEYLPRYFPKPQNILETINSNFRIYGDIIILQEEQKSNLVKLKISAKGQSAILFNKAYFPGWQAYINQNATSIINENGLIKIEVPEGEQIITLIFSDTNIRIIGNLLSFIGIIIFMTIITKNNSINFKKNE